MGSIEAPHVDEGAAEPSASALSLSGWQLTRLSALWFGLLYFWTSNQLMLLPEKVREFVLREQGNLDQLGMYRSLIDSVGAFIVILTQLAIGFISDHSESRLGRRRPWILFGTLTGMGGIFLFMAAPGYWWLFAAYLLIQFALNVASVPFQSLLPDLVPERQHPRAGAVMGVNHLLGNLVALLVFIGGSIVLAQLLPLPFGGVVAGSALGLAIGFVLVHDFQRTPQPDRAVRRHP